MVGEPHAEYEPLLSVAHVSIATWAVCASSLAAASTALLFWLRNDGIAIAARMPMIRMTTNSSISVKPASSPTCVCLVRIVVLLTSAGSARVLGVSSVPIGEPGAPDDPGCQNAYRPLGWWCADCARVARARLWAEPWIGVAGKVASSDEFA